MYVGDNGGSATWFNHQHHLEHYTTSRRGDEEAHLCKYIDAKPCRKVKSASHPKMEDGWAGERRVE